MNVVFMWKKVGERIGGQVCTQNNRSLFGGKGQWRAASADITAYQSLSQ